MQNIKAIVSSYIGVLAFAAIIYIAGGRLDYWQATLYLVVALAGTTLNHLMVPIGSDLTSKRASKVREGQSWDLKLLKWYFFFSLMTFLVAGLDSGRFNCSGEVPISVTVIGVLIIIAGQILFAWAKRSNRFFSSTVMIETERKHLVCTSGAYRFVRHPGYLGMLLMLIGFPLVLNAYLAYVPTLFAIIILVRRTQLEDAFLQANLDGYAEYSKDVKYRLFRGIF